MKITLNYFKPYTIQRIKSTNFLFLEGLFKELFSVFLLKFSVSHIFSLKRPHFLFAIFFYLLVVLGTVTYD